MYLYCIYLVSLVQGIETVRRDNCRLVKEVVDTSLRSILIHKVLPARCARSQSRQ